MKLYCLKSIVFKATKHHPVIHSLKSEIGTCFSVLSVQPIQIPVLEAITFDLIMPFFHDDDQKSEEALCTKVIQESFFIKPLLQLIYCLQ